MELDRGMKATFTIIVCATSVVHAEEWQRVAI
jgi:hypothetical protein